MCSDPYGELILVFLVRSDGDTEINNLTNVSYYLPCPMSYCDLLEAERALYPRRVALLSWSLQIEMLHRSSYVEYPGGASRRGVRC